MDAILVGADGSEPSLIAVEWAAGEARRRRRPLRIVHAAAPWAAGTPAHPRLQRVQDWLHEAGQEILADALVRARAAAPGLETSAEQIPGEAAKALLGAADRASMVVVGTRGAGGLTGLLLGSVALQVVSYAPCPAVAVRQGEPGRYGEVVVGVDGSRDCMAAVEFAFEEAALRAARLRAVLAWAHPVSTEPGHMQPLVYDPKVVSAEEEATLLECLAGHRERFPEVEVAHQVVHARPARALAGASAGADLLVLGSRGRGGFTGLVLGSVGHAMLHHAHCPVVVVPGER